VERGEQDRIHQEWASAEADFHLAAQRAPDWAQVDFMLGNLWLDASRPADARMALDRFLAREPDHVAGRVARGRALARLGEPLAAVRDYSHALARSGAGEAAQPEHYIERARALLAVGPERRDEALAGLDEGLARLGQPVALALMAVELELAAGRTDAALARLDRISARADRRESWQVRRGEILADAGRVDEARDAFRAALDALDRLPAARRDNRAARQLGEQCPAGLARLTPPAAQEPSHP